MDESLSLHEEEIDTEDDVALMLVHVCRDGNQIEAGDTSGFTSARRLTLECGHVRPIHDCRSLGVGTGHWAVHKIMGPKQFDELSFAGAAEQMVKATRGVSLGHVTWGEQLLLIWSSKRCRLHSECQPRLAKNVEATGMFAELHLGAVETVNDQAWLASSVHGHATHFADVREREDVVGNRGRIKPNLAVVWEVANELGLLESSGVGDGALDATARLNVFEHVGIVEDGNRRL